jgi:hypothetical protein
MQQQWFVLQHKGEYRKAKSRFEEIYDVDKDSPHFAEMKLLALLISEYEKSSLAFHPLTPLRCSKSAWKMLATNPPTL